jgi:hypothetical protein
LGGAADGDPCCPFFQIDVKTIEKAFDVVVCGGGLAGFCAAVAAARGGALTCLIQDRPVLGGNSSSEVRVTPHGAAAFHAYARETGIISEVLIEERARNHEQIFENGWTNSVWDLALYDLAKTTENLTLHVNTAVVALIANDQRIDSTELSSTSFGYLHRRACATSDRISAVVGRIGGAETELIARAKYFVDCTGDGVVADLAGCEWRMGSESREEFNEPHAPEKASRDTMGNSIHFKTRDMGRPVPFVAPSWAMRYDDARFFYERGRKPKDLRGGFWWLEVGVPWDTIHDAEDIRHELTRHALGVWDWIKNRDPLTKEAAAHYALDWIGQVPGKRESRRIMGRYLVTEHDIQNKIAFPDEIAFGGWFLDLHTPGGLLAPTSEPASAEGYKPTSTYAQKSYVGPYGIPLRSLISKDLRNLLFAGRNVSATHAALGTMRVMSTTALMGQAVGTACAHAIRLNRLPEAFSEADIISIQQRLLRDGCFLPNVSNHDPEDLAPNAEITASSSACFTGASTEDRGAHTGLAIWADQAAYVGREELHNRRGQWLAVGAGRIDEIQVYLTNLSAKPQLVPADLVPVDHVWDYRVNAGPSLAQTVLSIPPGSHWIVWPVRLTLSERQYVRLDLEANAEVCWPTAGVIVPGHLAAYEMGNGRMRRYGEGVTLCFRVSPPQASFAAENVISGVTRPLRFTNLWRSDPSLALPQWLELAWKTPQRLTSIELTFPGHLLREYHAYQPFYRDPQCPKTYAIEAWRGSGWVELLRVENNYQRQCRHTLTQAIQTARLRIMILATNGDPSAAIYEVRCYSEREATGAS